MASTEKILVLGANPAWQKTLFFSTLRKGEVNRAEKMDLYSSGKGINFCRAARCRNLAETHLFQFAGGLNGELLETGLEKESFSFTTVRTKYETRSCITCLSVSENGMTELIEPSFPVSEENLDEMFEKISSKLVHAEILAICGTMPSGSPAGFYQRLARAVKDAGKKLLFDAVLEAEQVLASGADVILKINEKELASLAGGTSVRENLLILRRKYPLVTAAITAGPEKAFLLSGNELTAYVPPKLDSIVSPIGSGDTASAVLASEITAGTGLAEAFASALAAASANCLSARGGCFLEEDRKRLLEKITFSTEKL